VTTLYDFLKTVDEDLYDKPVYETKEDVKYDGEVIYQEDISLDVARALLPPNVFSETCHYQLVTLPEQTVVLRIDDSIPESMVNENRQRVTEYVLNTSPDVISLTELRQGLLFPKTNHNYYESAMDVPKKYKSRWIWITLTSFVILLILGLCIFTYLLTL